MEVTPGQDAPGRASHHHDKGSEPERTAVALPGPPSDVAPCKITAEHHVPDALLPSLASTSMEQAVNHDYEGTALSIDNDDFAVVERQPRLWVPVILQVFLRHVRELEGEHSARKRFNDWQKAVREENRLMVLDEVRLLHAERMA